MKEELVSFNTSTSIRKYVANHKFIANDIFVTNEVFIANTLFIANQIFIVNQVFISKSADNTSTLQTKYLLPINLSILWLGANQIFDCKISLFFTLIL